MLAPAEGRNLDLLNAVFCAGNSSLICVIEKRVAQLLKDKETKVMAGKQAHTWLTKNVSATDSVIRAGSFRYLTT